MSIFEQATRRKLRFNSSIGQLSTEQLWDLPLIKATNRSGTDLDTVGRAIKRDLKTMEEDSIVKTRPDPRKEELTLQLAIVVSIVETKQAEIKKAEESAIKREKRRVLNEALAKRDETDLAGKSREDLLKELEALDD